jgi:phosphatidylglycerol:prolipoprotein diacylglycerol transferase
MHNNLSNNLIFHWNIDSNIFWITETFPLKYYGLLFALGILSGYYFVKRIYLKENIPVKELDSLLIFVIIGTLLGARLGHCFFYEPKYFLNNPIEILLPIKKIGGAYKFIGFQGLASHGGAIGVFLSIILFSMKYKIELFKILDKIAIGIPISAAFIRLGNFMNSEIYGKPTDGSWGVVFHKVDLIPRHPTQIYEAISYIFIFFLINYLYTCTNYKKTNGLIFGFFLFTLFIARFFLEFFKENQEDFENKMIFNMGQFLSIPFIICGLLLIFFKLKSQTK